MWLHPCVRRIRRARILMEGCRKMRCKSIGSLVLATSLAVLFAVLPILQQLHYTFAHHDHIVCQKHHQIEDVARHQREHASDAQKQKNKESNRVKEERSGSWQAHCLPGLEFSNEPDFYEGCLSFVCPIGHQAKALRHVRNKQPLRYCLCSKTVSSFLYPFADIQLVLKKMHVR